MAAEPSEPPRRPTGSIPLSWAVPAEAVTSSSPPRQSSKPVLAVVFGAIAAVGSIAAIGSIASSSETPAPSVPLAPAPAPVAPTPAPSVNGPAPAAEPAPSVAAPAPSAAPVAAPAAVTVPAPAPTEVQPVAAAEAAAQTVTPAARARARQLIQRARLLARNGKVAEAHTVAEQAVVADPDCGECWKTVTLLRKKTGDRAGAAVAKARADALGDDDTP